MEHGSVLSVDGRLKVSKMHMAAVFCCWLARGLGLASEARLWMAVATLNGYLSR